MPHLPYQGRVDHPEGFSLKVTKEVGSPYILREVGGMVGGNILLTGIVFSGPVN
jgi:hypothetical protein